MTTRDINESLLLEPPDHDDLVQQIANHTGDAALLLYELAHTIGSNNRSAGRTLEQALDVYDVLLEGMENAGTIPPWRLMEQVRVGLYNGYFYVDEQDRVDYLEQLSRAQRKDEG